MDENTEKRKTLDVARILIRRKRYDVINYVERIEINGELFIIKVVEDWYAPQWFSNNQPKPCSNQSSSDTDSSDEDEGDLDADQLDFNLDENEEEKLDEDGSQVDGEEAGAVAGVDVGQAGVVATDGENQEAMMNSIGNTSQLATRRLSGPGVGLNEKPIMENLGNGGECISNIVLTTCVNGKKEKVNFLNCSTVNVNVEEGKITYHPSPSLICDTPQPFSSGPGPAHVPSPVNSSPIPSYVPDTPTSPLLQAPPPPFILTLPLTMLLLRK